MKELKYGFNFNDTKLSPMKGLYTIFDESVSKILSDLEHNYITKDAARHYKFSKLHNQPRANKFAHLTTLP